MRGKVGRQMGRPNGEKIKKICEDRAERGSRCKVEEDSDEKKMLAS